MTDATRVVSVEIAGQRYPIRSGLDPEYVTRLAVYVDDKMRAAADSAPTGDAVRLAVLAALNIADEYHQLKAKYEADTTQVSRKVEGCHAMLDDVLKDIA